MKRNTTIFFNRVNPVFTPELVYFLGFWWADGHIDVAGSNKIRIEMRADDGEDIAPILEKVGQWSIYRRHRKGRAPSIRFSVSDEKFLSFLRDEGYLENPKRVLKMIPEELKYLWFRGLVDGDGCFYIHASNHPCYLNISSKVDEDWSYLTDQLSTLKIPFVQKAVERAKGNYSFVQIQRRLAIVAFGNWLYQANRDIGLRRKSLKFFKIRELLTYPA